VSIFSWILVNLPAHCILDNHKSQLRAKRAAENKTHPLQLWHNGNLAEGAT